MGVQRRHSEARSGGRSPKPAANAPAAPKGNQGSAILGEGAGQGRQGCAETGRAETEGCSSGRGKGPGANSGCGCPTRGLGAQLAKGTGSIRARPSCGGSEVLRTSHRGV